MSLTRRHFGSSRLVFALLLLAVAMPARADEAENRERLHDMPPGRRNDLLKNLDRFDALPSAERTAIREFDRRLSEEDPTVRARHLAVLRRYHLWLKTLNDSQRKALRDAAPDARIALINKYLKDEPKPGPAFARNDGKVWTQLSSLSPVLLADQAHWIRIWLGLNPKQREAAGRKGLGESQRVQLLEQFGRDNGVPDQRRAVGREEREAVLQKIHSRPRLKKNYEQAKAATKRAMVGRLADRRHLVENLDAKVDREHLDQFVAALPSWLLISVDSLPPDAAALRMRVLYRMLFPEGTEMPVVEAEKPKPPKTPPPAAPRVTPGGTSAF